MAYVRWKKYCLAAQATRICSAFLSLPLNSAKQQLEILTA